MKNDIIDLNDFNNLLIKFLSEISKKKNWKINDLVNLFKKGIKIFNQNLIKNNEICEGLVTTNGIKRRCSRKKKHGNLCGLHYNKEKRYRYIETIDKNIILYLNNNNLESNEIDNENKLLLNCVDEINIIWKVIKLRYKEVYLNNLDNYIYTKYYNKYIKIGIYDKINDKYLKLV